MLTGLCVVSLQLLLLLLSSFCLLLALPRATSASICHAGSHPITETMHEAYLEDLRTQSLGETVQYLYALCVADETCARAYYLGRADSVETDLLAFGYLVRHWTDQGGISLAAHAEQFCALASADTLRDTLWLTKLRLEACESQSVRCGANERFVFVPETLQGDCVCIDDHNCREYGNLHSGSLTLSQIALLLVSAVLTVYLALRIRNARALYRAYRLSERHCHEGCSYRKDLVRGMET